MNNTCFVTRLERKDPYGFDFKFLADIKNIVRDEQGKFHLEHVFVPDGEESYVTADGKPIDLFEQLDNQCKCETCSYHIVCSNGINFCEFQHLTFGFPLYGIMRLSGFDSNRCSQVYKCDAYDPVKEINLIHNKQEMIDFIHRTRNFFDCVEDYEDYYGFGKNENGEYTSETVQEYFQHGGKFTKIPTAYPAIVIFDYSTENPLKWESLEGLQTGKNILKNYDY